MSQQQPPFDQSIFETIQHKNQNDIALTEEENEQQQEIISYILAQDILLLSEKHSSFLNDFNNRRKRKDFTLENIGFENTKQFIQEMLRDISLSLKNCAVEVSEYKEMNAISIYKSLLQTMSFDKYDKIYEKFVEFEKITKGLTENLDFLNIFDDLQISYELIEGLLNGVHDETNFEQRKMYFDDLMEMKFVSFSNPDGRNILLLKNNITRVDSIDCLDNSLQLEIMERLEKCIRNAAQFGANLL